MVVGQDDEEGYKHGDANDEYFHDRHKEATQHVQLRECMLGDGPDIFD